jgi:hypothetical protein
VVCRRKPLFIRDSGGVIVSEQARLETPLRFASGTRSAIPEPAAMVRDRLPIGVTVGPHDMPPTTGRNEGFQ